MRVSEALNTRMTCRAFLDTPVPEAVVRAILAGAARAPSGGNLQPWRVWVLGGEPLRRLEAAVRGKLAAGQIADGPVEFMMYPRELKEPYAGRRFRTGEAMYQALGVGRDDWIARAAQTERNFDFFGAPVGLFLAIDRGMEPGQWADLGIFAQSVMLLAREYGLHTAALESWSLWHRTVRDFVGMPSELMLFCGLALGHMDEAHPVNRLRTERAGVDEFAAFAGFDASAPDI